MGIDLANIINWGLGYSKMGVWRFGDWFNPMIFEFDEFFHCLIRNLWKNIKHFMGIEPVNIINWRLGYSKIGVFAHKNGYGHRLVC